MEEDRERIDLTRSVEHARSLGHESVGAIEEVIAFAPGAMECHQDRESVRVPVGLSDAGGLIVLKLSVKDGRNSVAAESSVLADEVVAKLLRHLMKSSSAATLLGMYFEG